MGDTVPIPAETLRRTAAGCVEAAERQKERGNDHNLRSIASAASDAILAARQAETGFVSFDVDKAMTISAFCDNSKYSDDRKNVGDTIRRYGHWPERSN